MNTKPLVEHQNVDDDVELAVEELEAVIAPAGIIQGGPTPGPITTPTWNHNETLVLELTIENLEEVIAPQGIIKTRP